MSQITRRRIVLTTGALFAVSMASFAQRQSKIWRIGFLTNGTVSSAQGQLDAFIRGMNELGHL